MPTITTMMLLIITTTGDDVDGNGVDDFDFLCRILQHANVVGVQCRKENLDPQLLARLYSTRAKQGSIFTVMPKGRFSNTADMSSVHKTCVKTIHPQHR